MSNLEVIQKECPFSISSSFEEALKKYPVEMGIPIQAIMSVLPAEYVWEITKGNDLHGYIWLNKMKSENKTEYFLNVFIFEEFRKCGSAKSGVPIVESSLKAMGISIIYAQVNTNSPDTGLIARKILRRNGYKLTKEKSDISKCYSNMCDEDLIVHFPSSLSFKKILVDNA